MRLAYQRSQSFQPQQDAEQHAPGNPRNLNAEHFTPVFFWPGRESANKGAAKLMGQGNAQPSSAV
jgi:hypothetical protein